MATELAKAYVQIVPSARGIKGSIAKELDGEGDAAGKSVGGQLVGAIKRVLVTAGIGKTLSAAISEGAALEQSLGGIETLFGASADKVKQAAADAYRTAGLSANQYMELTTSFAASLLQGLAGDTDKASDIADMAMRDMADNANKMGTSMESIQNAYQGFAKNNYTMLDNLKLGYGGTKTEMERLLADAQELTGIEYNIDNLGDVYAAIHEIQKELGVTGTTAAEAAGTISGSLAAMKAAAKNVLGSLTLGQDIGPALEALAGTVTTFLAGNLLPAVWNILTALPWALITFIQSAAPQLATVFMDFLPQLREFLTADDGLLDAAWQLVAQLATGLIDALPQLLLSAQGLLTGLREKIAGGFPDFLKQGADLLGQLISGISEALPQLLLMGWTVISTLVLTLLDNLPAILSSGTELLLELVNGIRNALPDMIRIAGKTILVLVSSLIKNFPKIIGAGFDLIVSLVKGIGDALPDIVDAAFEMVGKIWDTIKETDWLQLGKDIIDGLINGIGSMAGALWDAAKNVAKSALDSIKNFFGIASPSRLMRDEVGRFIPAGIAVGIEKNTQPLKKAMRDISELTASPLDKTITMGLRYSMPSGQPAAAGAGGYGPTTNFYQTIHSHDALSPAELTREAEDLFARRRWKNP